MSYGCYSSSHVVDTRSGAEVEALDPRNGSVARIKYQEGEGHRVCISLTEESAEHLVAELQKVLHLGRCQDEVK